MASLYIPKAETADLAREVADLLGTTKTDAVHDALLRRREGLVKAPAKRSVHEIVEELRRTSTLRFDPGVVIDKAFYDSLNDEEED